MAMLQTGLMPTAEILCQLYAGNFDKRILLFYGSHADLDSCRKRIESAVGRFCELFGDRPVSVFSVSGRTELGGNHTDHQHGCVIAGGISLDILAVASPSSDDVIRVHSAGYGEDSVSCNELTVHSFEMGTSVSLLRGVAAGFAERGIHTGGFCAYLTSDVLKGSGLSSSAAYEVLLCTILNRFYAHDRISTAELARIAQKAENRYFGKPCGLMDQMACALGCAYLIDFAEPEHPVCEPVPFDPDGAGYSLCLIDTGADHADLTDEYSSIPLDMCSVANALGFDFLRKAKHDMIFENIPSLRSKCGDRALLRALHFYREISRVRQQADSLRNGDFKKYLKLVNESGRSSAIYLQNVTVSGSREHQEVALTLAICEELLNGQGACRVHGGGFAGTVQVYVPHDMLDSFRGQIRRSFGEDAFHVIQIRMIGAASLW